VEAPDYDGAEVVIESEIALQQRDIFGFPRGATAGKCLHAIFERLDFTNSSRSIISTLCAEQLAAHGFSSEWIPVVADMVERTVATPLDESGTPRLLDIAHGDRFRLSVHYPIAASAAPDDAHPSCTASMVMPSRADPMGPGRDVARGFMKSYIDLVFAYQGASISSTTNQLAGSDARHYSPAQLPGHGARRYHLQYLYCVAVHRYLRARLPGYAWETHFGGVRYLFLRGMRPELGVSAGIFHDKPSAALIQELDAYLQTGPI
jgi:exodeoxyribonuclease V beta subunit